MATPSTTRPAALSPVAWVAVLVAIGAVAVRAGTSWPLAYDFEQQRPLVSSLAQLDLRHAFGGGDQTSGPGYGLVAAPFYRLARIWLSSADAYRLVAYGALIPLAVATVAASRALGVRGRSWRELANVAAIVLGFPVLACYFEAFHPSDVLATAICLGAFAAFARGRIGWGAVLLGFALMTRQWALVLVALVAVAVEGRDRIVVVLGSLGTAGAMVLPFLVVNPGTATDALAARIVSRYPTTALGLIPLERPGLFVLARYGPLMLAAFLCLWFNRRSDRSRPAVLIAVFAAGLLLRPLLDPAGLLYYLAPGYAFAVLVRPTSWRWPVATYLGGLAFYVRIRLDDRFPTYRGLPGTGFNHLQLIGGSLSVVMTVMVGAAIVLALREVERLTEARVLTPAFGPRHRASRDDAVS